MIMNINTVLALAGVVLGLSGLISALLAMHAVRGWRARCLSVESSLTAVRREMELSLAARRQESQKGAARFARGEGRHGKFERQ